MKTSDSPHTVNQLTVCRPGPLYAFFMLRLLGMSGVTVLPFYASLASGSDQQEQVSSIRILLSG